MNPVRPQTISKKQVKGRSNGMNPVRPPWFYIYLLKSERADTLYTGVTNDLKKRFEQHNNGEVPYTKHRRPYRLIYFEACLNRNDAYRRERYLKTGMGKRYLKNRLKRGLTG